MRPQELVMVTPKELFRQEDALCVMTQCAVPEISDDFLAAIEPCVDGEVVLCGATPFVSRGNRVMITVCHRAPQNSC